MDLAELKQLEQQLDNLKKLNQELIDNQHQVVIYHKYFRGIIKKGPTNKLQENRLEVSGLRFSNTWNGRTTSQYIQQSDVTFDSLLDTGLIELDLIEDVSKTTKDYKNMSEVISEIRQEEEFKVKEVVQKALDRATQAEYNISVLEDRYKKKILESKEQYKNKIEKINKKFETEKKLIEKNHKEVLKNKNEELNELKQQFEDFKQDKKRISLEQQVIDLQAKINQYQSRGLWSRISNK